MDPVRESLVSSAGAVLSASGPGQRVSTVAWSQALSPWRAARAVHDPGKVLLDVAHAVALGGDCLADVAVVRAQPACSGRSPAIRRCRDCSPPWPPRRSRGRRRFGHAGGRLVPGSGLGPTAGRSPGTAPVARSSSTSTPRWWARTRTRSWPRADVQARLRVPPAAAPSSTTASTAPGRRWRSMLRPGRPQRSQRRPHRASWTRR